MIARWVLALGLVFLAGVGLLQFKRATVHWAAVDTEDEILAYEVTPSRGAVFELPAGLDRVLVSAYGVLAADVAAEKRSAGEHDVELAYGVIASLTDGNETPCETRVYETVSRVHVGAKPGASPAARLAYSPDLVTDPRTLAIDVRACSALGARLELRAAHGDIGRVLLRVSQVEARAPLERELVTRRLGPEKRAAIVEARASLGFADLPPEVQQRSVAGWRRRIGAVGQKDVDYVQRRLLLQKERSAPAVPVASDMPLQVAAGRVATFNLHGPAKLRIATEAGTIVTVSEGGDPQPLRAPESGRVDVDLKGTGPRSVEVAATHPATVRLYLEASAREHLLGVPTILPLADQRLQVAPEVRRHRYLRLHPDQPVVFRVPPGQPSFGFSVRARLLDSLALDGSLPLPAFLEARLRARWDTGQTTEARLELTPSRFDHFADDYFTTERQVLLVRPPPGARRLELYGDEIVTLLAWTEEPGVVEGTLAEPYAIELEEAQVWRNAAYETRAWATIWPENREALEVADRVLDLITQVRIERIDSSDAEPRPERALVPEGVTLRRQLISEHLDPAANESAFAWSRLERERGRVRVPDAGPDAGSLEVVYRAEETALGQTLSLVVDGATLAEEPLVLQSGRIHVQVAPGVHGVELQGAGSGVLAFAKVPPATGPVVRSHTVFALTPSQPLTFRVDKDRPDPMLVVFIVATEGKHPVHLSYTLDEGRPGRHAGSFYRRTTQDSGTLSGVGGVDGKGLLWEAGYGLSEARAMPDGITKLRVLLGDDLRQGPHRITLRLPSATAPPSASSQEPTVWVRAVLVGSESKTGKDEARWWTREVEP